MGNLPKIEVTDGEDPFPQIPAGIYRPVLSGVHGADLGIPVNSNTFFDGSVTMGGNARHYLILKGTLDSGELASLRAWMASEAA